MAPRPGADAPCTPTGPEFTSAAWARQIRAVVNASSDAENWPDRDDEPTGVASVTVIGTSLTAVDIDATAAYALGPDAVGWLRTGPHSALVVHTDGTTTVVDASSSR